jgi:hypothetical protein
MEMHEAVLPSASIRLAVTMALASPTWNYMKRFLNEACTIPLASIFIQVCYIFFLWVIPAPSMHLQFLKYVSPSLQAR